MADKTWTRTLDMELTSELDAALRLLGDVKASGQSLKDLSLVYDRIQRAADIHRDIAERF